MAGIAVTSDSVGLEIVSDEEFNLLDDAIRKAMQEEGITEVPESEDISSNRCSAQRLPTPLEKYRGSQGYVSVSDLTAQFWCEQQMEYSYMVSEKRDSEQMQLGRDIHMARELELYELVHVDIESKEDKWASICLNCLTQVAALEAQQVVRELAVFGEPFRMGIFVYGIIDELRFNKSGQLELLELKTRSGSNLPSKAQQRKTYLQAMLYSVLFNALVSGEVNTSMFLAKLQLSGEAELSEDVVKFAKECGVACNKLSEIADITLNRFQFSELPRISSIVVEYCSQDNCSIINRTTMELDEAWTQCQLATLLAYWRGERHTVGVEIEEAWKCQRCDFADICVWRMKKHDECRRLSSSNKKTIL